MTADVGVSAADIDAATGQIDIADAQRWPRPSADRYRPAAESAAAALQRSAWRAGRCARWAECEGPAGTGTGGVSWASGRSVASTSTTHSGRLVARSTFCCVPPNSVFGSAAFVTTKPDHNRIRHEPIPADTPWPQDQVSDDIRQSARILQAVLMSLRGTPCGPCWLISGHAVQAPVS
jgi:hypothetical protein